MVSLEHSRKEVRARRADLVKSLEEVRHRLSPAEVVDDAAYRFDPSLELLARAQAGIARNPLLAIVLLAGAGWLVSNGSRNRGRLSANGRGKRRPPHIARLTHYRKGEPS